MTNSSLWQYYAVVAALVAAAAAPGMMMMTDAQATPHNPDGTTDTNTDATDTLLTPIMVNERDVLLEFYAATGGDAWNDNYGWADDVDVPNICEWHGVICNVDDLDADGRNRNRNRELYQQGVQEEDDVEQDDVQAQQPQQQGTDTEFRVRGSTSLPTF
jgi:hypothetical protein